MFWTSFWLNSELFQIDINELSNLDREKTPEEIRFVQIFNELYIYRNRLHIKK